MRTHPGRAAADGELTVAAVRVVVQGTNLDLGPAVAEHGITVRAGDDTAGPTTGTDDLGPGGYTADADGATGTIALPYEAVDCR